MLVRSTDHWGRKACLDRDGVFLVVVKISTVITRPCEIHLQLLRAEVERILALVSDFAQVEPVYSGPRSSIALPIETAPAVRTSTGGRVVKIEVDEFSTNVVRRVPEPGRDCKPHRADGHLGAAWWFLG